MIVVDTSALISLATIDTLETVLTEFDVHTTEVVVEELKDTATYDDKPGAAANQVLQHQERLTVHQVKGEFQSSRVDEGEGSCALLTKQIEANFLITDDFQALPELQTVADSEVAISPIILKALVKKDALESGGARQRLEVLAEERNWLEAPIYRYAQKLFENS